MADFVAVLRKTVEALGENTPEMRDKVFEKARATIDAKLKAIQPPPPQSVMDRQRRALEDAIAVIKADYARKAAPEKEESLEDIFASLKSLSEAKPEPRPAPQPSASSPRSTYDASASPRPAERKPYEPYVSSIGRTPMETPPAAPVSSGQEAQKPSFPAASDPVLAVADDEVQGPPAEDGTPPATIAPIGGRTGGRRASAGLIAATIALLVVAAGGYGIWVNRDDFAAMVGLAPTPAEDGAVTTAGELTPPPATDELVDTEEPAEPQEEEIAALPPVEEPMPAPQASDDAPKFTQRLLPDGSEIDEGPAGGPRSIGEGSSVASATQAGSDETLSDAQPEGGGAAAGTGDEGVAPTQTSAEPATPPAAVAVGQKAIFYEERTTAASGSAEVGNIVWSVVEESPGGDLPAEPAIRAQATIPGKDIQLRMTIRRNRDQTLPASHIIEMIFLTPEGFDGGAIASVSRVSFKETEQAAGNALIGIPAKIADGFFLIALGDAPAEIETNTTLLRRQSWIDIPITYESGRRALLSMEKGIPGDKVFQDTLRAWAEASSG